MDQWQPTQIAHLQEIGQHLRQTREGQSLSLQQVSDVTHIRSGLLGALEAAHLPDLPEPVYLRALIKRYGDALGLSGEELVDQLMDTGRGGGSGRRGRAPAPRSTTPFASVLPQNWGMRTAPPRTNPPGPPQGQGLAGSQGKAPQDSPIANSLPQPTVSPIPGKSSVASPSVASPSVANPSAISSEANVSAANVSTANSSAGNSSAANSSAASLPVNPSPGGTVSRENLPTVTSQGANLPAENLQETSLPAANWEVGLQTDDLTGTTLPYHRDPQDSPIDPIGMDSGEIHPAGTDAGEPNRAATESVALGNSPQSNESSINWAGIDLSLEPVGQATRDRPGTSTPAPQPLAPVPIASLSTSNVSVPGSLTSPSSTPLSPTATQTPADAAQPGELGDRDGWGSWLWGGLVVASVALVLGWGLTNEEPSRTQSSGATGAIAPPSPAPAATAPPAPSPSPSPSPSAANALPLTLTLTTRGTSWLQVTVDGQVAYEGLLNGGQTQTWKAEKTLRLIAGRPDLVWVGVNGAAPQAFGTEPNPKDQTFPLGDRAVAQD